MRVAGRIKKYANYSLRVELIFLRAGHTFHRPIRNAAAVVAPVPGARYGSRVVTHDPVTKPVNSMANDATPNATLVRDAFSGARLTAHISPRGHRSHRRTSRVHSAGSACKRVQTVDMQSPGRIIIRADFPVDYKTVR